MKRHKHYIRPGVLIIAILGIGAGVFASAQITGIGTADAPGSGERAYDAGASPALQFVERGDASASNIHALAWSDSEELWFAAAGAGDSLVLGRVRPGTGEEPRLYEAPLGAPETPHTYLAADPGGPVWLAAGYAIFAFDPDDETFTTAIELALEHPDAASEAFERGSPLPGTWINGMVARGESIEFTRNHVPATFEVADGGAVARLVTIDATPNGLWDLGDEHGVPYVRGDDGLSLLAESSVAATLTEMDTDAALTVAHAADCTLASSPTADRVWTRCGEIEQEHSLHTRPDDIADGNSEGYFVMGLQAHSEVAVFDAATGDTRLYSLGTAELTDTHTLRGGWFHQRREETGAPQRVAQHRITAVAIAPDGTVAFADSAFRLGVVR